MKLRILHLEDNPDDADLVRLQLASSGLNCDILPVNSQESFLEALQQPEFDVILSDSGVPGYDGRSALAAAHDTCPGVPFIVVSGSPPRQSTGSEPRAAAAVAKSELEQLAPTIRETLREWTLGDSDLTPTPTASSNAPALSDAAAVTRAVSPAIRAFDAAHESDVQSQPLEEELETASYVWGMQQLVSVVQRLSLARSLPSIMEIVRHAARNLVSADGATFVLRDGDKCFYAEEDAIGPLWKGRRFPLNSCISGASVSGGKVARAAGVRMRVRISPSPFK